jgi:beta-lactamase superfamily II metal-dependent hydrolase
MEVMTFYAAQGDLVAIRAGDEGVIVDAHMPDCDDVSSEEIAQGLETYLHGKIVRGLILTGLDRDHACPAGVEEILSRYRPDWVMYPSYYKDTETATEVFAIIDRERRRRQGSSRPLQRLSICLSKIESRFFYNLAATFSFEIFSPYVVADNSSNNNGIVVKIRGLDPSGFTYLATGDTESDRWARIDELFGDSLRSDILSAPHHGARGGVNVPSLLRINPDTVLISAGVDNPYEHPASQAVAVYNRVANHVYATNVDEGVCLFTRRSGQGYETQLVRYG